MEDIMEKINLSFAVAEDSMRHLFYENLATQSGCHRRLQFPPKLLCCDVANPIFLARPNNKVPSFIQFDISLMDTAFAVINHHASKVLDSQLSWRRTGEHCNNQHTNMTIKSEGIRLSDHIAKKTHDK